MTKENGRPTSSATASGSNNPSLFACCADEDVYPLWRRAHSYCHSVRTHSALSTGQTAIDSSYGLQLPSSPSLNRIVNVGRGRKSRVCRTYHSVRTGTASAAGVVVAASPYTRPIQTDETMDSIEEQARVVYIISKKLPDGHFGGQMLN